MCDAGTVTVEPGAELERRAVQALPVVVKAATGTPSARNEAITLISQGVVSFAVVAGVTLLAALNVMDSTQAVAGYSLALAATGAVSISTKRRNGH